MASPDSETLRDQLVTEARLRFGAARAEALLPELDALTAHLARVSETPLAGECEPGFFLLRG